HGVHAVTSVTGQPTTDAYAVASPDANGVGTVINDPDPAFDDSADKNHTSTNNLAVMSGRNHGNLLNDRGVSCGWFKDAFRTTTSPRRCSTPRTTQPTTRRSARRPSSTAASPAGSRTGAAPGRGCRSWCSPPGPRPTTSTTSRPSRPRSPSSSRTTG